MIISLLLYIILLYNQYLTNTNLSINNYYIIEDKGKYGIVDNNGNIIVPNKYSFIFKSNERYCGLKTDSISYIYDLEKKKIVYEVKKYFYPLILDNKIMISATEDSCFIYDYSFNLLLSIKATKIESLTKEYLIFEQNKNIGVIDFKGNVILAPQFDKIYHFSNENLYVNFVKYGGARGLEYPDKKFQWAFHSSLFLVERNKRYGLYDINGKELLPVEYDYIWDYSEKCLIIAKNNKWGLIDSVGNPILPCEYEQIGNMNNSIFKSLIAYNFGCHFVDELKDWQDVYNISKGLSEGLIKVKKKKWGFIDETGKFIIKPQYDDAEVFSGGLAAVKKKGKWGFIDKTGKIIIPIKYDEVTSFKEDIAFYKIKSKWGIINKAGEIIAKPRFIMKDNEYFTPTLFIHNPIIVKESNKYGFIDEKGNVSSCCYDSLGFFNGNIAWARKGHKLGIINKNEEIVLDFIYDISYAFFIQPDGFKFSNFYYNNKIGKVNNDGKIIIEPKYDNFNGWLKNGKIVAIQDSLVGVVDTLGNTIIPFKYDNIEFRKDGLIEATIFDSIYYYRPDFRLLTTTKKK